MKPSGRDMRPDLIHVQANGRSLAVRIRINPRARQVSLRVPASGPAGLTLPSPRLRAQGIAFAEARAAWLAAQMARRGVSARPFVPGLVLPIAGEPVTLAQVDGRGAVLRSGRLDVGGDPELFAGRVRRWLLAEARRLLSTETRALADAHGLPVGAVRVGDPTSRWGSCSSGGTISYSWRLLLAPPHVRRAVVAHEVAHLVHRHHGPDFWAFAEALSGEPHAPARAWLRQHGAALHGWGSEG